MVEDDEGHACIAENGPSAAWLSSRDRSRRLDGLDLLRATEAICFVLVDLFMPRMDGFGLLRAMVNDPRLAVLPVCLSTSAPVRGSARCGLSAQADRFAPSVCDDRLALPGKERGAT